MNRKMLILMLLLVTLTAGCIQQQTAIKSQQQVSEAVKDVSQNAETIGSTLNDIDEALG